MKHVKISIIISLLLAAIVQSYGQNTQMPKWAFNGKQIDFTQSTPQVQNTNASLSSPRFVSNAYYDNSGARQVYIVDNQVFWENGNLGGTLFPDNDQFEDQMTPELVITPKESTICGDGEYYACYIQVQYEPDAKADNPMISYKLNISDIVPGTSVSDFDSETILSGISKEANVGMAVSDFIPGTYNRRIYVVYREGFSSGISKILRYDLTPNGLSTPVTLASNTSKYWEPAEVELSANMDNLYFVRPKKFAHVNGDNSNDITVVPLDPATGNINGSITEYDLEQQNSIYDHYIGIELDANENYAYVVKEDEKMLKVDLSNGNTTDLDDIDDFNEFNTQLERARNGLIYAVKSNGEVYYINESQNQIERDYNLDLTSSGVIRNKFLYGTGSGNTVYVIPDQIDGCAYDDLFGTVEECCYIDLYTPANDNMPGVQIQTSGTERDIIIQSGNSVTWTATSNSFDNVAEAYMEPGDIIIEPGASLTIEDMIIHFREGYEVQMDNNSAGNVGSRLVLDNTTLTVFDECEGDKLWAGVDLDGGWGSLPQTPYSTSPQPYLEMQNGSTIEFAEKGIDAPAGGLIRASDSYFENNITNVDITGFEDQNSLLENSVFVWDDALYNKGYIPANSLHLWNASGVNVKGCNFVNNANSSIGIDDRGVGVLADITDFSVKGSCADILCLQYNRNSFENLKYGIKSNGGDNVLIDRSDFIENRGGAWIISSEALQFTRNDLNVYDYDVNSSLDYETFGLYLEGCTGYQVEENDFHDGLLGLVVYNSGYDPNEIYYNDFYNLNGNDVATGAIGMGANGWIMDQPNGLQFRCNDFNQTDYAIGVTGGDLHTQNGLITVDLSTISWKQGQNFQTGDYESADNTFWLFWLTGEHDFYIDENVSGINLYGEKYRYNGAYDNLANRDANINNFNSNEVGRHYYGTFTTREEECPSNLGGGGWIPTPLLLDDLNQKNDSLSDIEQEYNALLSIQNENSLQLSAQNANEFTTHNVHNALMEASPYLTASVLNAYMMNNQVSEMSRTSVLLANSPLPVSVQENLNNADLSSNLKQYIRQQQDGENPLERMENQISTFKSSIQYITDRLHIRYMNSDSVELISEWQQMLESKSDFHSKEKLVSLYKSAGNLEAAENLLANMETELIGSDKPEKLKQIRVKQVELRLRNNDVSESLNASDKKFLYSVAEDYNNRSGSMARGLLMSAGLETYEPVIFMPNPTNAKSASAGMISEQEDLSRDEDIELSTRFNIYPNPATDILSVE